MIPPLSSDARNPKALKEVKRSRAKRARKLAKTAVARVRGLLAVLLQEAVSVEAWQWVVK